MGSAQTVVSCAQPKHRPPSRASRFADDQAVTPYDNIAIVLVHTTHPGNIGAAARAMKNMGLSQLRLVEPKLFPHAEATARASGADDVLAAAGVFPTLDAAVADCTLVVGASARQRTIPWPVLGPRETAAAAWAAAEQGRVALVFGRENSGLTNAELDRCQYLVQIPTNPEYSSLNLAAAVQVLAYELRMAVSAEVPPAPAAAADEADGPASAAELEGLYGHLEQTLVELDFLAPDNPRQLMRRLRRLFNRSRLERMEVNILRGILSAAQKASRGRLR